MRTTRIVSVAAGLLCLCAIAVGVLAHGATLTMSNTDLVMAGRNPDHLWLAHLEIVEQELAQGHVDAAVRAWHDAYCVALESRGWEGMIAVGDSFMSIGRAAGSARGARMNAKDAYSTALIRARRVGSVEGVLRTAEAFQRLDDRIFVEQCLSLAARLAAGDEGAGERVREAQERWAAVSTVAEF
jgi:hypothetical protein